MAAIAEKFREVLHIGDFEPTSFEPEQRMLHDADEYAQHLRRLEKAARQFQKDVGGFMDSTGKFLTGAPFPRVWVQPGPIQPAEAQRPSIPERHAALFTAELQARLAEAVPATLCAAIESDLVKPLTAWLEAHDSAKDRLKRLEGRRLEYDAARRRLGAAADRAAAAEAGEARDAAGAERRLGRAEGEAEPLLLEFESERAALDEHLEWMAAAAARLKAYVADTAAAMRDAATSYTVPEGLLEPYPESAKPVQITAEAPAGAAPAGGATAQPPALSDIPPVHADVPEGAQVGGHVQPQGPGIGGFIRDTLKSAVGLPTGPPAGAPPPAHEPSAVPTYGDASAASPASAAVTEVVHHVTSPQPAPGSAVTEVVHHVVTPGAAELLKQGEGAGAEAAPQGGAAGAAHGGAGAPGAGGADAPYVECARAPRPYELGGGELPSSPARRECRMPDDAARGIGARGRALSGEVEEGAAAEPEPEIEHPEQKQVVPVGDVTTPGDAAQGAASAQQAGEGGGNGGGGILGAIKAAIGRGGNGNSGGNNGGEVAAAPAGEGDVADTAAGDAPGGKGVASFITDTIKSAVGMGTGAPAGAEAAGARREGAGGAGSAQPGSKGGSALFPPQAELSTTT